MENSSSKYPVTLHSNPPSPIETEMASTLTLSAYPSGDFHRNLPWHEARWGTSYRTQCDDEEITLPSIKQAVPEVLIPVDPDAARRRESSVTSPGGGRGFGLATPPEYVHSPSQKKRRRVSLDSTRGEERAGQIPRLYAIPQQSDYYRQSSPARPGPSEPWGTSNGNDLYATGSPSSSLRPLVANGRPEQAEPRPTLPSLPFPPFAERVNIETQRVRGYSVGEYYREPIGQPGPSYGTGYRPESGASAYTPSDNRYGYPYVNRNHSLSIGSARPYDRTPFSPGSYGPPYQDPYLPIQVGALGIGAPGDNRQRKRRGNLPKETTDKLRAWFQAHLSHPYPTEDEKQDLVRQTGLQLNQISNWFINARRRQLPTLQKNARAESFALSHRNGNGKAIGSPEGADYVFDGKRDASHLSEGESNNYDDGDLERLERHRPAKSKRGSI